MADLPEIKVKPICAEELRNVSSVGKMDPFCKVIFGTASACSKPHVDASRTPKWNEEFTFIIKETTAVTIEVWDRNQITKDEKIGTANADVNAAKNNGGVFCDWIALTHNGRASGRIQVQLTYIGTDLQPATMLAPPGMSPAHMPGPGQPQMIPPPGQPQMMPPPGQPQMMPPPGQPQMMMPPPGQPQMMPQGYAQQPMMAPPGYPPQQPMMAPPGYLPQQPMMAPPGQPMMAQTMQPPQQMMMQQAMIAHAQTMQPGMQPVVYAPGPGQYVAQPPPPEACPMQPKLNYTPVPNCPMCYGSGFMKPGAPCRECAYNAGFCKECMGFGYHESGGSRMVCTECGGRGRWR